MWNYLKCWYDVKVFVVFCICNSLYYWCGNGLKGGGKFLLNKKIDFVESGFVLIYIGENKEFVCIIGVEIGWKVEVSCVFIRCVNFNMIYIGFIVWEYCFCGWWFCFNLDWWK